MEEGAYQGQFKALTQGHRADSQCLLPVRFTVRAKPRINYKSTSVNYCKAAMKVPSTINKQATCICGWL